MKSKARKACRRMLEKDIKHHSSKKRRKQGNHSEAEGAIKSLITSSLQQYRTERKFAFLTSHVRPRVSSEGRDNATKDDSVLDDIHCNVGASFAQADGLLESYKAVPSLPEAEVTDVNVSSRRVLDMVSHERVSNCAMSSDCLDVNCATSAVAGRSSLLETIFSPGFQLFKAVGGDCSTSCISTVEQVECPDVGNDSAETTPTDINSADCPQSKKSILSPCSAIKASANAAMEPVVSLFRTPDAALCFSGGHGVSHLSKDDGAIAFGLCDVSAGRTHLPLNQASDLSGEKALTTNPAPLLSLQQCKSVDCEFSKDAGDTEEEDDDELEDFDPYLFMKHLPELSDVVSPCRPSLLPRQTRRCPPIALVLDLDETLVHSTLEHCDDADFTFTAHFNYQKHTVYVRCRPHLQTFLARVAQLFEIIVFTASQSIYAEKLLNILDPKRKLIQHRVFRDSCIYVEGNYLKDLTILGRDLSKVAIVDNSPQAFGFQVDNGIPIESWFDDHSDDALLLLLPFLETLVGADDVRSLIANRYNLRKKIASATNFIAMQAGKL